MNLALTVAAGALAVGPAAASDVLDRVEPEVRLVDLRDLRGVLTASIVEAHQLVAGIGAALNVQTMLGGDGIFIMKGERETIDRMTAILDGLRASVSESYTIEVVLAAVDREHTPALGGAIPPNAQPQFRHVQMIRRGNTSEVRSLDEVSYIAAWQPVVGDSAVGYDIRTDTVEHGLRLEAIVSAIGNDQIAVTLEGSVSQISLRQVHVELGDLVLPVEVPTVRSRSIQATAAVSLTHGAPVVITLFDGFDTDRMILLAVAAKRTR